MGGIINRKLDLGNARDPDVVEEIVAPRESTLTEIHHHTDTRRMLKHVSGHPWTVRYYGQIVNEGSVLNHIDVKSGDLAQSYIEIKDMTLKVQSTLSHEYDIEQGVTTLNGGAITPYKIRPYPGDVFIGNVDDGEDVVFVVSEVERLSHRKETLYSIQYNSLAWVNDNKEFINSIEKRINESYYYDNKINSVNSHLLIESEDKFHIDSLINTLNQSREYYFDRFLQRTTSSMLIPGIESRVFDKLMLEFVTSSVDMSKFDTIFHYNYSNYSKGYDTETILDALLKRQIPKSKRRYTREVFFADTKLFTRRASLMSPIFSGVDYISIPNMDRSRLVQDMEIKPSSGSSIDIRSDRNYYDTPIPIIEATTPSGDPIELQLLPFLLEDDHYIVSPNFYQYLEDHNNFSNLSFCEVIIFRFLNGEEVSKRDLFRLLDSWEDWSYLHQFYLLPVLWLISKNVIGVV